MKTLLATTAVLALLAAPAQADALFEQSQRQGQAQGQIQLQGQQQGQGQHQSSTNVNSNVNVNANSSRSNSHSSSHSGAVSGSLSGAAANNRGNSFSSSTSVDASDDVDVDAEPAYAPDVNLTSTGCIGSVGGSAGGMGLFTFGFAKTSEVVNCFKLEAAKIYLSMGDKAKAVQLMESVDYIGAAVAKDTAEAPAPRKLAANKTTSAGWPNGDPTKFKPASLECTLGFTACTER